MRPRRNRPRSVGIALAGAVAIITIVVLGGLLSLLPRTGLDCPQPGARVMLDPGHGGDDPGATNDAAGLVEPEPNYAKTFWGIEEKDAAFASVMQAALVSRLQPGTDLGDSGLEVLENGGLLTARMPAVLVEPVFLSNTEEAARLADPGGERLDAIAAAVADGVDAWLSSRGLGPIDLPTVSGRVPGVA